MTVYEQECKISIFLSVGKIFKNHITAYNGFLMLIVE